MRPVFRTLSVVAVVFGVSGMAYYYDSLPAAPSSLTAQAGEAAEAISINTPPLWQKTYKEYDLGRDDFDFKMPPKWGWPNPRGRSSALPFDYHATYSYFDAFLTNDPTQNVVVQDTVFPDNKHSTKHEQKTTGSLMASPGQSITLEWACQPLQFQALPSGACGMYLCHAYYLYYEPRGKNFTAKETDYMGRTTVTMGTRDTTYTLTCKNRAGYYAWVERWTWNGWATLGTYGTAPTDAVMNITVKVCPLAPAAGSGAYKLAANSKQSIDVRVGGKTYAYCFNNPTSNTYLIPAHSSAEMDTFIKAVRDGNLIEGTKVVGFAS